MAIVSSNSYLASQIAYLENCVLQKENTREALQFITHSKYKFFSEGQRFFFLLSKVYGSTGEWAITESSAENLEFEWYFLLQIRVHVNFEKLHQTQIDAITNIAREYGVIPLHEQVPSKSPRLILGCGHGNPNDSFYSTHAHCDADTIDGILGMNPTWVGEFGNKSTMDYLISKCRNYYHTIVDEGPIGDYTTEIWEAIDCLLQPAGIFLAKYFKRQH